MTHRDRWGLRGPIRECRLERATYSRRCGDETCETDERHDTTIVAFRPVGTLAERHHRNHDGSEWQSEYVYDADERLIRVRSVAPSGRDAFQLYEYDSKGRLITVIARDEDGRERVDETYEYDDIGRKKKTNYVDVASQRANTSYSWGVEGSDAFYSAAGAATLTTQYEQHARPTGLVFLDADGRVLSRVDFAYDEGGHLVTETQTTSLDILPAHMLAELNPAQVAAMRALIGGNTRRHRYDDRGLRVETRTSMRPMSDERQTTSYNAQGDPTGQISEHDSREFSLADDGGFHPTNGRVGRSEVRFFYEYDERGNWVKKVVEARSEADQTFRICSVERRTLAYYDDL